MKFNVKRPSFQLNVSLDISERERIGIIGPNGAGKSTLLAQWALMNKKEDITSVLLEQRALCFPHLSVLENVAFAPRAQGSPAEDARRDARAELVRAGLGEYADVMPGELSGGQQQRVALLRALATNASCVLLDEPLAGLDVEAARQYRQLLSSYDDRLAQVVIATHDPLDLLHLVERVIVLDEGLCVKDMTTQQLFLTPPDAFSARLVQCNRVVMDTGKNCPTTYWFSPRDAVLSEKSTTSPATGFAATGIIVAVDQHPHHIQYEIALEHDDQIQVSVIADKGSLPVREGHKCDIYVPAAKLRKNTQDLGLGAETGKLER